MTRLQIILVFLLAACPHPAQAAPEAHKDHSRSSIEVPFKLEAYRRRGLEQIYSLTLSEFRCSIRRDRSPLQQRVRHADFSDGFWRSCPQGYRSRSLELQIEMAADYSGELLLRLYNHDNQLLSELRLPGLESGVNSLAMPILDSVSDRNPTSLQLLLSAGSLELPVTSLVLRGDCGTFGSHLFASYFFHAGALQPGQSVILF